MPALGTRGGMSARGFGMFGFKKSFIQGAYGLFTIGNQTANNMKYAWAPETTGPGQNFTQAVQMSPAAGNSVKAIFAAGLATGTSKETQKYIHASNATSTGGVLTNGCRYGSATSNSQYGIFYAGEVSGTPSALTTIYEHANDSCANGGTLFGTTNNTAALGNSVFAIISRTSNNSTALTMSYTYPNGSSAAATAFPLAKQFSNRYWGNADVGIYQGTSASGLNSQKYIWATNTTAAAGVIGIAQAIQQGCGNDVYAISPGSNATNTIKYTYATDVTSVGLAFTTTTNFGGATNNGLSGVNA